MRYELKRPADWLEMIGEIDRTGRQTVRYVYVRYADRWDVYKVTDADLGDLGPILCLEDLISVREPAYRVASGECSCDGFTYRGRCRHSMKVADATK